MSVEIETVAHRRVSMDNSIPSNQSSKSALLKHVLSIFGKTEGGQWLRKAGGTLFLPKGGGTFSV